MLLHVQSCNCLVYADALLDGLCSFLCGFSLQIQLKFVLLEFVFDLLCSWSLHSFGLIYCAKKRSAQVFQLLAGFVSRYWWNTSHSWWKRHVFTVLSLTLLIVLRLIYRSGLPRDKGHPPRKHLTDAARKEAARTRKRTYETKRKAKKVQPVPS